MTPLFLSFIYGEWFSIIKWAAGNDALFCACLKSIFIVVREEGQMLLHMVRTKATTVMLTLNKTKQKIQLNLASKILTSLTWVPKTKELMFECFVVHCTVLYTTIRHCNAHRRWRITTTPWNHAPKWWLPSVTMAPKWCHDHYWCLLVRKDFAGQSQA